MNVAGVNLQKLNPDIGKDGDRENWNSTHKKVVDRYIMPLILECITNKLVAFTLSRRILLTTIYFHQQHVAH